MHDERSRTPAASVPDTGYPVRVVFAVLLGLLPSLLILWIVIIPNFDRVWAETVRWVTTKSFLF
jgi:hypothetical protein